MGKMKKLICCLLLVFCMGGLCYADQVFEDVLIDTDEVVGYTCVGVGAYALTVGTVASTVGGALLVTAGIKLLFF